MYFLLYDEMNEAQTGISGSEQPFILVTTEETKAGCVVTSFRKYTGGDGRLILHITKTKLEYRQSWLCQELLGKLLQRHFLWSYRLFWTNDSQPILYVGLKHLAFVNVICKQKHTFTNKKKNVWRYFIRHRKCGKDIFFPLFFFVRLKSLFLSFSILTTRGWSSWLPLWPK